MAGQLAVAEVADLAERWITGEGVACNGRTLAKHLTEVQQAIDNGNFLGSATGTGLIAAGPLPLRPRSDQARSAVATWPNGM